jgi:hypothetical protein
LQVLVPDFTAVALGLWSMSKVFRVKIFVAPLISVVVLALNIAMDYACPSLVLAVGLNVRVFLISWCFFSKIIR